MPLLSLALLGDFQMRSQSGALINLTAKKSQALLAFLAMKPDQRVSRDKMAGLLWSSTAPEQARQSLRQTLSNLRKELAHLSSPDKILVEEGDLLGLDSSLVEADVATFESLVASDHQADLEQATSLYRGDLLDGFQLNEDRFDQWVLAERDRLHRMAIRAHTHLMEHKLVAGDLDGAIATGQRTLRLDLLQEAVHRSLMRLYMQSGDLMNALQQYDTLAKALKRELAVEPEAETKALHQQIVQMRANRGASAPGQKGPKTILVVEDNTLSRELTHAVLKAASYSVLVAKDGAEALMLIGRESVDLLLLDIDLPYIDGHSVLQALKEKGINVPTIFLSGLPGDEPELRAFAIGAADFIRKPVKNSVLLARVAKVLKHE